ncbi:MAG: allophanate hydrolase [Proteobacteria bacterium]|nr:allophanate hydrolase [Pseudomonadota bacterium]
MTAKPVPLDIRTLHAHYAGGHDPAAVIETVFASIDAADDPGIFICLADRASVLAAARALPRFDPIAKPLWGVPFAVKDNIDVAGLPTTAAAPAFAYTPEKSAHAVERLIAAGALMIGKTNLDQFAAGLVGVRTPYPVPRNAVDPSLVPGGSSSGSAVAVARGLVSFALGTDTAGSGRVPAGLNNIVGLKPSVGAISTTGVVPACRTLDCVSVFALTVDDAWRAFASMAGPDATDAFSRPIEFAALRPIPKPTIGIPRKSDLHFFGDDAAAAAWLAAIRVLDGIAARYVEIDMAPFFETAQLLYEGPWIAERLAAIKTFADGNPDQMHPVTRSIVSGANKYTAVDAFVGHYRLAELKRRVAPVLASVDAIAVPTAPFSPTLKDLRADPFKPNAQLGTYTNFVNLLDMCGIAVPGPFRPDRRASGLTFLGGRGRDAYLASLAREFHAAANVSLGATGWPLPQLEPLSASAPEGYEAIVVVGAHMSAMPLNGELTALGGVFLRAAETMPIYRLFALAGGPPKRPGLVRVGTDGHAIRAEIWALPLKGFGRFVAGIPSPLGIGTIHLADGQRIKGFLCESEGAHGAEDISSYGSWREFVASRGPT